MLRPGLVRIPDISIYEGEQPTSNPTITPPLIAFEIISRDDRYSDVLQKLEDYRQSGVVHIWVVDPWTAKLQAYSHAGLQTVEAFEIPNTDIRITLDSLLAGLRLS